MIDNCYLMLKITFHPLTSDHFPLLCKWLNVPHVNKWYGEKRPWTLDQVRQKYGSYAKGEEPIQAFVIYAKEEPIGYIQVYNAKDFPPEIETSHLKKPLGALDFYIGEPSFLRKGYGEAALRKFLNEVVFKAFASCLVDPDAENLAAIKCYEKCGFRSYPQNNRPKSGSRPCILLLERS